MSKASEFTGQLRELAGLPITKIGIASSSGRYFHYTEFDDSDLIELLKSYLMTVKLKKYRETIFTRFKRRKILGGNFYRVNFTVENTAEPQYLFFHHGRVKRLNGDDEYTVISELKNPLFSIEEISKKRHGSKRIDSFKFDVSWSNFDEMISEFGEDDHIAK